MEKLQGWNFLKEKYKFSRQTKEHEKDWSKFLVAYGIEVMARTAGEILCYTIRNNVFSTIFDQQ